MSTPGEQAGGASGEVEECGYSFDHDEQITYDGPDGVGWTCRRCGAEGWEDR